MIFFNVSNSFICYNIYFKSRDFLWTSGNIHLSNLFIYKQLKLTQIQYLSVYQIKVKDLTFTTRNQSFNTKIVYKKIQGFRR